MRRTTSVDQRRGDPGQPQHVEARGRDLLTRADGTVEIVDEVRLQLTIDPSGTVTTAVADPPVPELSSLVGLHASKGFRGRIDELLPDHRDAGTVLHQLLDDLPMASLISMYGATRELEDWTLPPESAARMTDLCSGWAAGATMLDTLDRTGTFPIPVGPPAPDLSSAEDVLAWHDLPVMAPRSVRRRRRLDLLPGDPHELDVHFRDSHLGADGLEDVLHEYSLSAALDPERLVVLRAEATVRVLPWPECPGALGSVHRVVGEPVGVLREKVATELTGTSTCTHLNDVLRSLSGAAALVAAAASV